MPAALFIWGFDTLRDTVEIRDAGGEVLSDSVGGRNVSASGFNRNSAQVGRPQPTQANA